MIQLSNKSLNCVVVSKGDWNCSFASDAITVKEINTLWCFRAGAVETPSTAAMTPRGESEPANGENKPPQAIVKPHVLTHVIEGFVIQEGAEPFPVSTINCYTEGQA